MVTPPLSFRQPGQDADQEKYSIFRPLCFRLSISTLIYAMIHTVCLKEGRQNIFSLLVQKKRYSLCQKQCFSQITENFRGITEIAEGIIWSQGFLTLLYIKRSFNRQQFKFPKNSQLCFPTALIFFESFLLQLRLLVLLQAYSC